MPSSDLLYDMVLQKHSMIVCLKLKSDLGGGTPNSLRNTGGGKSKRYVSLHRGGGGFGSKITEISVT